jgi:hypothetical protein
MIKIPLGFFAPTGLGIFIVFYYIDAAPTVLRREDGRFEILKRQKGRMGQRGRTRTDKVRLDLEGFRGRRDAQFAALPTGRDRPTRNVPISVGVFSWQKFVE